MRILITAGATREPIDSVRYITNFSTGSTGASLAEFFAATSEQVYLLCGEGAVVPSGLSASLTLERFSSFSDLESKLKRALHEYVWDVVIHAAAVSDYSVASPSARKLDSGDDFKIELKRNPKLVNAIRSICAEAHTPYQPYLIAFKLTDTDVIADRERAVAKLLRNSHADLVVHNDFSDIRQGVRRFDLWGPGPGAIGSAISREDLSAHIQERIHF